MSLTIIAHVNKSPCELKYLHRQSATMFATGLNVGTILVMVALCKLSRYQ